MSSSREVGDKLERDVLDTLGEGFKMTAGSGSKFQDGDLRHNELVVECKVKGNCKGFTAPASELNKLIAEADKQLKDWLYVEQNAHGRQMVLCDLEAFERMTRSWRAEHERD